jgi:4a-hydroxytetrahydrobiopterin dehydratase
MPQPLSRTQIDQVLTELPNWTYDADRLALRRRIVYPDFAATLAAMIEIGFAAERADHHPEWSNVYNRLDIWLTTHDVNGVSDKDVALATIIDALDSRAMVAAALGAA